MQNILPFEQVLNKGKDKNMAGLPCGRSQPLFIVLYFQVIKINP